MIWVPGGQSGNDWAEFTVSSNDIIAAQGRFAARARINTWDDITSLMCADDGSSQNQFGLYLDNNNKIFSNNRIAGGRYNGFGSSNDTISANTTYIIEYQRDVNGHQRRIFVDGVEVASNDEMLTAFDPTRLRIGNIADSGKGDVHIDTVVISSDPADDLYTMITNHGPGYPGSAAAHVTFWWTAESTIVHP